MSSPDNADALRSFLSNHVQELGVRAVIAKVATLKPFSESPEIRVLSVLPVDQPAGPMGMADAESQRIRRRIKPWEFNYAYPATC